MRMIDADVLEQRCNEMIENEWNKNTAPYSWAFAYEQFVEDLEDAPEVDAAEVVRCKDCRHSDDECHKDGLRYCMRGIKADDYNETGYIYPVEEVVRDVDYCSYGERRSDNADD